jgi:hypothetical protein
MAAPFPICGETSFLSTLLLWQGQQHLMRNEYVMSIYSPVHVSQGARHTVTTLGNVVTTDSLRWMRGSIGKGLSLFELLLLLITGTALLLCNDGSGC